MTTQIYGCSSAGRTCVGGGYPGELGGSAAEAEGSDAAGSKRRGKDVVESIPEALNAGCDPKSPKNQSIVLRPAQPESLEGFVRRGTQPGGWMAAPWWGGSRRGRQHSNHGAFRRFSILLGILSSSGKPASNLARPSSACAHYPKACPALIRHTRTTLPSMLGTCAHADAAPCSGSKRARAVVRVAGSESDGAIRATFLWRRGTPAFA